MMFLDGDPHLQVRRHLNPAFAPRVIESLRPAIQQRTDELIDEMLKQAQHTGEIELMSQFAHPLPARVIVDMLGISREDQAEFLSWSQDIVDFTGNRSATLEIAHRAQNSIVAMREYFRGIVTAHRQQPNDDIISLMLSLDGQGETLDEDTLLSQCILLLIAGHETTRNLIGNGMLALLQHPDQYALLQHNPALIHGAIEEMVRFDGPAQFIIRVVGEDFEWQGQELKRGQKVLLIGAAANRDPDFFPEPDRFDITRFATTRSTVRSLAWGHGPHKCIGLALANLEAEIAFTTLLRRLPNLRLVNDTPDHLKVFVMRGLRALPLAYTPQSAMEQVAAFDATDLMSQPDSELSELIPQPRSCPFHAST
jgi:hypothetical protein